MELLEKDTDLWKDHHVKDQTPWHQNRVNPMLLKYLALMTAKREGMEKASPLTVFLPLCGRSRDLLYLYQLGHTVIGCEAVEKPVRQFFQESKLDFEERNTGVGFALQTLDGRLRVFCCNYFDLTQDIIGIKVDTVWDKASLGAMMPELAPRYVKVLRGLLSENFNILLGTAEFEQRTHEGHPYSYSFNQIRELYGNFCSIKQLENRIPENNFNLNYYFLTPLKGKEEDGRF